MRHAFCRAMRRHLPCIFAGILLIGSVDQEGFAQNRFWNPLSVDTNWMNGDNWDPPGVPSIQQYALITLNGTYDVVLAQSQSIRGLTLGGAAGEQTLRIEGGAVLDLAQMSSVQGSGVLVLDDATLNGPLENHATIRMQGGTISSLNLNRGIVEVVDSASTIETTSPTFNGDYGTLRIAGESSDAALTYNTQPADQPLVSAGRIELVSSNGRQAMLQLPGGHLENLATGVISLSGGMDDVWLYTSHVENHGLFSGQGSLNGSFRQTPTGSLQLDISGTTAGEEYDVLDVTTTADLDGQLIVDVLDGFEPADTDQFHILRRSNGSGEFDAVQVSGAPGYAFSVDYRSNGVFLNFRQDGVLQGDYNNSGLVEQGDLDFVLSFWGTQGRTPIGWTNDLPDSIIDQNELDRVLANWGKTQPVAAISPAGVPEPSAAVLLLLAVVTLLGVPTAMRRRAGRISEQQ
jgi:hypothetical protein